MVMLGGIICLLSVGKGLPNLLKSEGGSKYPLVPPVLFCELCNCTQQRQENRKTRIFSLDNYGQKTCAGVFFFLFAPLRLRRNNFSSAITRLTIERESEREGGFG